VAILMIESIGSIIEGLRKIGIVCWKVESWKVGGVDCVGVLDVVY
jgi:hypothetical protein